MNLTLLLSEFDLLWDSPDAISQLRDFIIHLAIRGQLLPQDINDECAQTLFEKIQAKRETPVTLPIIPKETEPFRIPTTWQWVRFGHIISSSEAGWSPKTEGFPRTDNSWGVVKVSAVSWGHFLPEENKQLLPGVIPPERTQIHLGDFLISRANTAELVAKCVVVEVQPQNLILSDKIVRLQFAEECCKQFYCLLNNHAPYARNYYAEEASGTSHSMKNVSREVIYALPVPLPPAAEQRRIVNKVRELMALCDGLEKQLARNHTLKARLPQSILYHALTDNRPVDDASDNTNTHSRLNVKTV